MDFTNSSARSGANGRQRFIVPNSVYFDGTKFVENITVLTANGGYGFYEATANNKGINSNYLTSAATWKIREIDGEYGTITGRTTGKKSFVATFPTEPSGLARDVAYYGAN